MNKNLTLHIGKIKEDESEIVFIEGYADKNNVIQSMFDNEHDIGFTPGEICIDLIDEANYNMLDTKTISKERYKQLTGKDIKQEKATLKESSGK